MGGDHGPRVVVPAALRALQEHENLTLILVGDEPALRSRLHKHPKLLDPTRLQIQHASEEVNMDESPATALRTKKDSSMRVAINLVKEGRAHACVSAGNTGALMATARFVLKTLPGIDRPAITSPFPTEQKDKPMYMLDLGANVDSTPEHLLQFAIMGSILYASAGYSDRPRVALLNIGEEDIKGNELVKKSAQLFAACADLNYVGFVEGDDLLKGNADVIVCDGFVGNVVLKTMEGVAKKISHMIKLAFKRRLLYRIAAFFAAPALLWVKKQLDPSRYNGASMLGLQGIVIKSHGGANILGFVRAIEQAVLEVEKNVPELIRQELNRRIENENETHIHKEEE